MWQRSSRVENISIQLLTFSGVVQLGEVNYIDDYRLTLAVQREHELFFGNEAPIELFQTFYKEPEFEPIYENIRMTFQHKNPCIHVNKICLQGVSNSGIMHIGNGDWVNLNSRTLHIRHLSSRNKKELEKEEHISEIDID